MKTMQKPAGLKYALLGLAAAATLAAAPAAQAKGPVIALSNAYYGNTWRHQMVEAFRAAATEARKKGEISKFIIVNGNGTVNEQMSQVSDLILRHVNVIAIDAASDTALNGIIAKACAAGSRSSPSIPSSARPAPTSSTSTSSATRPRRRAGSSASCTARAMSSSSAA
jgi:ribose transport system substrate-binding protein